MDITKQLDQMTKEIADTRKDARRTEQAYVSNKLFWRESKLKGIWKQYVKDVDTLIAARKPLQAKLTGSDLRASLLAHNQSGCHLQNAWHKSHSAHTFLPFYGSGVHG